MKRLILSLVAASVLSISGMEAKDIVVYSGGALQVSMASGMGGNIVEVHSSDGALLRQMYGESSYTIQLPRHAVYTVFGKQHGCRQAL